MSSSWRWRALLVIVVLAGAAALVATRPPRLGLDLRGGTQIVLEARDSERQKVDDDTVKRVVEVLRRRVDALGVAEPTLQRSGDRRVIVELPGVADPDQAVEVIGKTAQLSFHAVQGVEPPDAPTAELPEGTTIVPTEEGERLRLAPARLDGSAVTTARASFSGDIQASWQVEIDFTGGGGSEWERLTGEAACSPSGAPQRRVAIVLDNQVISSPQVATTVQCGVGITGGSTVITGDFSEEEAKDLALLVRAGALPVPVEIVEQRTIGPTLGDAAIRASVLAAGIGAVLTILFLIAYYRLLGLLAALGLLSYGLVSYGALLGIGATLTLPGIAGFVLAIGMAVDANVLVFERAKEEYGRGVSIRASVRAGFRRAWSAIADSNVTTLLAAMLLFYFASGAVKGFAVTLGIGVAASMFSALVLTRLTAELVSSRKLFAARPGILGLKVGARLRQRLADRGADLMGRSRLWFALSAVALIVAVAGIGVQGFRFGLEFSGGRLLEYSTERQVDLDRLRSDLAGRGLPSAVVQLSGDGNVAIRTGNLDQAQEDQVAAAVRELGGEPQKVRDEFVGPSIGDELRRKALIALVVALAAQLLYLAVRFRWTWGASAIVTMAHDITILLGVFAWLGKELDGVFLAALLTVIGYSVNDSVVIFDRIRELRRGRTTEPLGAVANDACLQTIPRTINTGLGALFILVALLVLGGETLTNFALALIVGIVVGTWSSVFTAAPLSVALEGRWPSKATRPAAAPIRKPVRAGGSTPAARPKASSVAVDEDTPEPAPVKPAKTAGPPRTITPRPAKKKSKRR